MLSPWKKSFEKTRQHIKKQRHNFADKGLYSQSYGFSSNHVWMWQLGHKQGWVPKIWCFQTVVLEKTLERPQTARMSNQSILKEIYPEYSLAGQAEVSVLRHLKQRTDSLAKTLMPGKIEGRRRRGWQRMRWLDGVMDSIDKLQKIRKDREAWHAAVHGVTKSRTWLNNWQQQQIIMHNNNR